MTFHPPRIGPISGVLTAPTSNIIYVTGNNTGYCSFPILGPPQEIGFPSQGPACPADQSVIPTFTTSESQGYQKFFALEIAGVNVVPVATASKQAVSTTPFDTGTMTPGNGYFAAIEISDFMIGAAMDFPPAGSHLGSHNQSVVYDVTFLDGTNFPEYGLGVSYLSLPTGSYDFDYIYELPHTPWHIGSLIFASNGQLPTIIQKAYAESFDMSSGITFASPPHAGNVIVFSAGGRSTPGVWSMGAANWNALPNLTGYPGSMRLFYHTVCT